MAALPPLRPPGRWRNRRQIRRGPYPGDPDVPEREKYHYRAP